MKKYLHLLLAVVSAAVLAWSCQEKEPAYLFTEQAAIVTDQEPYKTTIEVKANVPWTVTSEADWCAVYGEKGSYRGSFELVIDRNSTIEDRQTNIILTGGGETFVIAVTQTAAGFGFSLPITDYSVNNQEQDVEVAYVVTKAGTTVKAYSSTDWAKIATVKDNYALVNVAANKTGKIRGSEISLVATGGTGDPVIVTANLTQSYTEDILDVFLEEIALGSEGETRRIPVQSNSEMNVLSSEPWCIAAADGSFIVISAEANTTGKAREAFVSLSLKDGNNGSKTKLIKVTQAASDFNFELPVKSVSLNRTGDKVRIPFTSDATIALEVGPEWCQAKVEEGFIAITADENKTGEDRSGYITAKAQKDGRESTRIISVTQGTEDIVLDVVLEELVLNASGEARNIPYSSDCSVSAKVSESWLTATVAEGLIAVSAEPNTTSEVKEAYVTVTASGKGKSISKTVKVLQSKSDIALELTAEEVLLGKSGEAQSVPFMSTSEVTVESGAEWCQAEVSGQFISISAKENKTGEPRSTYVVVKTASGTENDVTKTIKVTQASSEAALDIPVAEAVLNKLGSEVKLPYTASCDISAESNSDWCYVSVKDNYIVISADENTGSEKREALITVKTESGSNADVTKIITVTQTTEGLALDVHTEDVTLNKSGEEVRIPYTASGATISAESGAEWCKASINGSFVCISADENNTSEIRSAFVNVIAKSPDGNSITKVIRVNQVISEIVLELTASEVMLGKSGEAQSIPFTSNAEITVTSGESWCTAVSDGQFITISAKVNKTGNTRMAFVAVKTNSGTDNDITKTIKVVQSSAEVVLDVPVTEAVINKLGDEIKLPFTASCDVKVESNSDWCKPSVSGNYIVISADENTASAERKAIITVRTASGTDGDLNKLITVTQTTEGLALEVHTEDVTLSKEGEEVKVPFTSSGAVVTVESGADWCKPSVSGQFINISADENNGSETRSAFVTVTATAPDGKTLTKVIRVNQIISKVLLDLTADETTLGKSGEAQAVPYTSNYPVTAESGASWCTAVVEGKFISVSATENKTGETRSTYISVKTTSGTDNDVTKTIKVTQTSAEVVLEVPVTEGVINKYGNEIKFPYTASCEIEVESNSDWCTPGIKGNYITVSAAENTTSKDREAVITVRTVSGTDGDLTSLISITQTTEGLAIKVHEKEARLNMSGDELKIPFTSSGAVVTAESGAKWCHAVVNGQFICISADKNKTSEVRMAYVNVVATAPDGNTLTEVITVSQDISDITLELTTDEVLLGKTGKVQAVPFTSNSQVSTTSGAKWCTVSVDGNYIKVKADENKTGKIRSTYVTVKTESGTENDVTRTIKVSQAFADVALEIPVDEGTINKYGDEIKLPFTATCEIAVESNSDWCTASASGSYIVISAEENTGSTERKAIISVKTTSGTDLDVTKLINITQTTEGLALEVHAEEVELNDLGETVKLPYTVSGAIVTAEAGSEWCQTEVSGQFISISADKNTGDERSTYVNVLATAPDGKTLTKVVKVVQAKSVITLDLTADEVLLGKNGKAQSVPFTSNCDVTVESGAAWCEVTVDGGFISISAKTNKTGADRSTYVTVKTDSGTDNDIAKSIKVTQASAPAVLEIPVTEAVINKLGDAVKLPYTASCDVTAESNSDWCTAEIDGNYIAISADENTTSKERQAIITVKTASGTDSDVTEIIKVTQSTDGLALNVHTETVTLNKTGEAMKVPFTSSGATVTAKSGADWCKAKVNGQFISISADENNSGIKRYSYVNVTAEDLQGNTVTRVIEVTQLIEELFLDIDITSVSLDKNGSAVKIPYASSSDIKAASGAAWCTASVTGNFIQISAEANGTTKERTCYVRVQTVSESGNELTETITVTQSVDEYILDIPMTKVVLNSLGDSQKIPFFKSTGATINIAPGAEWFQAEEENSYIKVTAQENKTGDVRSAYLTVRLTGVEDSQAQTKVIEVIQTATEVALYVPETELSFLAEGQTRNLPYDCGYGITASSSESWLTATVKEDNAIIELKAEANATGNERVAFVTVSTTSGTGSESSLTIKVTQSDKQLYLELDVTEVSLDYTGEAVSLPYSAPCEITVTSGADWCQAAVDEGFISFTAESNENGSERTCYVTVKTNSGLENELSKTVKVTQGTDSPEISFQEDEIELVYTGGDTNIPLTCSGAWQIDNSETQIPEWLTITPTSGTGNTILTINATTNKFAHARSARVCFTNTDSEQSTVLTIVQEANENGIEDYLYLGKGYDCTGYFAEETGVKAAILDCEKLAYGSHIADLLHYNQTEENIITGKTLEQYQSKYSATAGISGAYSGFSASVEANFSETAKSYKEYQYATLRHMTKKQCLKIYENEEASDLIGCVTEAFLTDVENLPVNKLVDKYGTHVITGFSLGGVLEFSMSADVSSLETEIDWGLAVKAGYEQEAVGKVEGSASYSQYNNAKSAGSSYESRLKCRGGQSQYASMGSTPISQGENGETNYGYSSSTYTEWLTSLNDNKNWVLVDYEGSQLIPLWEFIEDETKSDAVKEEIRGRMTGLTSSQSSVNKKLRVRLVSVLTNMVDEDGSNEFGMDMSVQVDALTAETIAHYENTSGYKFNISENVETVFPDDKLKQTQWYDLKHTSAHTIKIKGTNIKEFDGGANSDDVFKDIAFTLNFGAGAEHWTYKDSNNDTVQLDNNGEFKVKTTYKDNASTYMTFTFKLFWE